MKRIIALLLAVLLTLSIAGTALAAQSATVKGGWLRMRSEPNFGAQTIASYYTGTVLSVISKEGSWYYVQAADGMKGYMYGSYLTISGSSGGTATGETGYVTSANGRGVRLRAQPAVANNVIGLYNVGTRLRILNRLSGWDYVQIGDTNMVGYMMSQYVTTVSPSITPVTPVTPSTGYPAWVWAANGKPVRLRSGPGTGYSIIGAYSVGTQVIVLNHGTSWDQVRIASNGSLGYMMNRYLTASTPTPVPPTPVGQQISAAVISDSQPTVGEVLYPIVSPTGADYTCMWYNDIGTLLSTGASYQAKAADRGHALRVVVSGRGTWSGTVSSGYTAAVTNAVPVQQNLTNVTISGGTDPKVGQTLTAAVAPAGATASYSWYRDTGILVGNGPSYTLQTADAGYRFYCAATGTGSWSGTVVSASTAVVTAPAPQPAQALSGSVVLPNGAVVGMELVPAMTLNSWQVDYAWYQNGVLISTAATLTLTNDMAGDDIRLVVTAQTGSGFTGSVGSNYCYVQKSAAGTPGIIEI